MLLNLLGKTTGTPVVLNTSFNLRGEPIVCTSDDAIKCVLGSEIDVLVMNNFWIEKTTASIQADS
jgi:carbamoyltransferase